MTHALYMTFYIDIQHASAEKIPFDDQQLQAWACLVLRATHKDAAELTLRLVNIDEITALNATYRHQQKPTNVLAFPSELPVAIELDCPFLGDVVICPAVLQTEAEALHQPLEAHWALIVMHGVLHLLGYDHIEEHDAQIMQAIEIDLLKKLGFDNPYHEALHLD